MNKKSKNNQLYLIGFYVPKTHLETVKNALFTVGAGRFKNYKNCCWQTKGIGQFYSNAKSKPYLGKVGKLTRVIEYKAEMICEQKYLKKALAALKATHPYEEPAYQVILLRHNF
jgi:structural toxin protein (hemagglutinin/hemolysin) RtxA